MFEISTPELVVTAFSMDSWRHIYTGIISFQSWDDWLVTHFINKSESMHEVVVREVLGAYDEFPGQLPFSPLLFHEIDLLLSAFPSFIIIEQYIACRTIPL